MLYTCCTHFVLMSCTFRTFRTHFVHSSSTFCPRFVLVSHTVRTHFVRISYTFRTHFVHISHTCRAHFVHNSYRVRTHFVHISYAFRTHFASFVYFCCTHLRYHTRNLFRKQAHHCSTFVNTTSGNRSAHGQYMAREGRARTQAIRPRAAAWAQALRRSPVPNGPGLALSGHALAMFRHISGCCVDKGGAFVDLFPDGVLDSKRK